MRIVPGLLMVACLLTILSNVGCSGAIDKVVDNRITKMVEEENKKLPSNVSHGIKLIRIDYNEAVNKLVMNYSVPDKRKFEANVDRIKRETNDEVHQNGSLSSAFEYDVRVFHEFYDNDELSGRSFKSFETPKR